MFLILKYCFVHVHVGDVVLFIVARVNNVERRVSNAV